MHRLRNCQQLVLLVALFLFLLLLAHLLQVLLVLRVAVQRLLEDDVLPHRLSLGPLQVDILRDHVCRKVCKVKLYILAVYILKLRFALRLKCGLFQERVAERLVSAQTLLFTQAEQALKEVLGIMRQLLELNVLEIHIPRCVLVQDRAQRLSEEDRCLC